MFLDNDSLRSWSPWRNVKRLFKKKDDEIWESIALQYFLVSVFVFCGYGLFVFLDSVSVLRFNFVFFFVRFRLAMLISVLGFVFLFPGSVFLFWVSVLSYVFLFWVCSLYFGCCCCFLVLFCFYQPPYIFDSPLHLNPTTGEHFKLRRKFLHRYQIVQVRNNLL